ncbi:MULTISPECIES: hypothetical protein [Bacteroidota]|uniref:hypothetical protein n=1 Tax=Bacteroidota TaxID=976 RepID=UPI0015FB4669|nr:MULTISPECIES: hypothetical protein [Bacteroidota]MBA8986383.1 hypothetical protein [Sphingobacterium soli]
MQILSSHRTVSQMPFPPASTWFFYSRASMPLLSHFKSKGMIVFLTQEQGHALGFAKKSPPIQVVFVWQNVVPAKH